MNGSESLVLVYIYFPWYIGVLLTRTCAISNIELCGTKTSVPSAFTVSLNKTCLLFSNFGILNFPLSRTNFWSLGTIGHLYLELFIIKEFYLKTRFSNFRGRFMGLNFMTSCLSTFCTLISCGSMFYFEMSKRKLRKEDPR